MALSEQALCTVTELKTYLNIGDTHKSTFLEYLIEDASHRIIDRLGYDPHSDTYADELYSGDGSHELVTKARPITSLVAVQLWDGETYADIDSADLAQMQNRSWYIDGVDYAFAEGRSNYAVTYVAGYSDTEVTHRFRSTCLRVAAMLEKESGRKGTLGISSQSFGDGSRTTFEDVIEKALDDLQTYRRLTG
jgi:hypothetical protein